MLIIHFYIIWIFEKQSRKLKFHSLLIYLLLPSFFFPPSLPSLYKIDNTTACFFSHSIIHLFRSIHKIYRGHFELNSGTLTHHNFTSNLIQLSTLQCSLRERSNTPQMTQLSSEHWPPDSSQCSFYSTNCLLAAQ